ncbi:hypothetical protein AUEXF2481DRAFT_87968 [Aureobasidium subglaciale EXF-2481]|uniref:Uncharacterized protein n=1 Tax=Aureobasidium subglaciale (strain EXF-2481) TaxID=1043005 RepID=A0A074YKL1_AURSE|nr:uncharacterized protein AUEXF2481DRAFT_87968 [Aureobasidium subglaciale EXF-2481]KEQ96594.1 hypothetical protein AUEXF2481DRAFT_87968 [Aureobasidium subglaciale EXF-2481]
MACKPNRNITDFFKPFAQPKVKRIVASEGRSASEPQNAPAATTKVQQQHRRTAGARFPMPSNRSASSKLRDIQVTPSRETTIDRPIPTPIPSSPPVYHAPTRVPRELSPLTSPEFSPSPPSPPPTIPKKLDIAPLPTMNPSVSCSSLSSLPISSQSSSKRIIRDGMLAVTNSDSDSNDTDSESLDDIDELIRRKRLKMTPPTTSSETSRRPASAARELRSSTRRDRPSIPKSNLVHPPRKKYKFSMASLVASHNKDSESIQRIQEYEEEYKQEIDLTARLENQLKQASDMNAEEFAARLQADDDDDDETRDRVVRAIERNDVLEKRVEYPFFRHADSRTHMSKPFPELALSTQDWKASLRDQGAREELLRCGFVADMARVSALPDELIQWMSSELLRDPESSLANAYVDVLESSFSSNAFTTNHLRTQFLLQVGREDLEPDLFVDLESMPPPAHQRPYADTMPFNTDWTCLLLTRLANKLHVTERRSWLTSLMLLLVDPQVEERLNTQQNLQDCIGYLLGADSVPSVLATTIEYVGQSLRAHIPNPILIQRLIGLLPSTTSASHTFKRRLGLASFMKSNAYLTNSLHDTSTMHVLTLYLHENRAFKLSDSTDFHKLGARFDILDVAIGMGLSDFGFQATGKADSPVNTEATAARLPTSEEESKFNSAIDEVVAELRSIAFNIRDSGAAHMRRTECKTAIEKLTYRLEFASRTRPKPKKGIFGAAEGASDVIRNFVARGEQDMSTGNELSSSSDGV